MIRSKQRLPLVIALLMGSWSALLAAEPSPPLRPNIVFIMADDLGYTDVACFGSKYYETPHLDRLAAQGMKLLSHHHCQNCTPTRAALMSGQYGTRTGVYTVGGTDRFDWSKRPLRPVDNVTELPLDRDIIAKQLQAAGYATGMFDVSDRSPSSRHIPCAVHRIPRRITVARTAHGVCLLLLSDTSRLQTI